jgi:hypothetical protein
MRPAHPRADLLSDLKRTLNLWVLSESCVRPVCLAPRNHRKRCAGAEKVGFITVQQ